MTTHEHPIPPQQLQAAREGRLSLLIVPVEPPIKQAYSEGGPVRGKGDDGRWIWDHDWEPVDRYVWRFPPCRLGDTITCEDVTLTVGDVRPVRCSELTPDEIFDAGFHSQWHDFYEHNADLRKQFRDWFTATYPTLAWEKSWIWRVQVESGVRK